MRNGHPGQNKESGVVREQVDVLQPFLGGPADEAVALAQVAGRRTPRRTGDRAAVGEYHVFQMLADRLGIAEVMMLLHQAIEQWLVRRTSHLAQFEWADLAKARV